MISLLELKKPNLKENLCENDTEQEINLSLDDKYLNPNSNFFQFKNYLSKKNLKIIGKIDSKFYLIKKLGKGSYSKVYLGISIDQLKNTNFNEEEIKYYSIKVIDPKMSDVSMFKNEVQFLENIEHDNILKIYAYGAGIKSKEKNDGIKKKKIFYIVMEYLEHGELLNYITKISKFDARGFGEDLGKLIFAQLLDGLEEIHSKNIFHRDIKLENIMLGNDYIFKYVDFGFCTNETGKLTEYLGTPSYAAPELHLKRSYFAKSEDIFSLGVTLFIIVTGSLPFKLAMPNDTFYQFIIKSDYVGYWKKRNVEVSPAFMELFDNMIAFDCSQRPSISEIRQSPWMKNINYDLLPLLKKELSCREKIMEKIKNEELIVEKKLKENNNINNINKFSLLEPKKPIRKNSDINDINEIENEKGSLYNNITTNEESDEYSINDINNSKSTKSINNIQENIKIPDANKGFIKIKAETKNVYIVLNKLKACFKYKGYSQIKMNINEFCLRIIDSDIDVVLKLEKYSNNYIKLYYFKIKGLSDKFDSFKKKINLLRDKIL